MKRQRKASRREQQNDRGKGVLPTVHFTSTAKAIAAFRGAPPIDFEKFRSDVDAILDQDPTPRA
jgi:hypothetical protein